MAEDIPFGCICGTVGGRLRAVAPGSGARYICHCDDCQAFAVFLGREHEVLDENAGTDVFQTSVSRLEIDRGKDRLACVNLTEKPTLRWYAACCDTPLANTTGSAKFPFLSVLVHGLDAPSHDAALGPVKGHLFTAYARGEPRGGKNASAAGMIFGVVKRMIGDRLTGSHRNYPLFDPATGRPIAAPRKLSAAERARIDEYRAAAG